MVLIGSMEEMPGTNADIVLAGAGKEDERLSGGVGLAEYEFELPRKGGRMPLLEPLEADWSMDRCDMVVAGEEWKEACVSAGVVAVTGDRLFAMLVDSECMPCWKKDPGFKPPGVLLPPY